MLTAVALAAVALAGLYRPAAGAVLRDIPQAHGPGAFSYVEVGTSDYDTLLQRASPGSRLVGLSVDALALYVDRLPGDRPGWVRDVAAVADAPAVAAAAAASGGGGPTLPTFFVHPADLEALCGASCFELRGCNSVGAPHPQVTDILARRGAAHLLRNASVRVVTLGGLLGAHRVGRVGTLKLDTEGWDARLLGGLVQHCAGAADPDGCWPGLLYFESNALTPPAEVDAALAALGARGYKRVSRTAQDTLLERRPNAWRAAVGAHAGGAGGGATA